MAFSNATCTNTSLLSDAHIVLNWNDPLDENSPLSLGLDQITTLCLRFDRTQDTATFRFRVPFPFSSSKKGCGFIYAFIDPRHIESIKALPTDTSVPDSTIKTLLCKQQASTRIVALELCLSKGLNVVGPSNVVRLSPKGNAAGNTLATLRSLVSATRLRLFVPHTHQLDENIHALIESLSSCSAKPNQIDHALDMLYCGDGGKDITQLLAPFTFRPVRASAPQKQGETRRSTTSSTADSEPDPVDDKGELPPAYEQFEPSEPPPIFPQGKRRASPGLDKNPNLKRPLRRTTHQISTGHPHKSPPLGTESGQPSPSPELAQLRAELNALRWQLDYQAAAAASPTEDGSLADRLDSFDKRLDALESRLEKVEKTNTTPSLDGFKSYIDERIKRHVTLLVENRVAALEDDLEHHRDEIRDELVDFKDDIEIGVQERIKDAVQEDLESIVAGQLSEVVEGIFESRHLTMHFSL